MTFLRRLGQIIVTGLQIAENVFLPTLARVVPGVAGTTTVVSQDIAQLLNIIVSIEAVGAALGTPGSAKLAAAAPQIAQVLMQSSALAGKPVQDPALFLKGATSVASGLADVLNAIHPDAVVATTVVTSNPTGISPAAVPPSA